MKNSLIGKTAIICGSSQGIGKSIANILAQSGVSIILLARNKNKLKEVYDNLNTDYKQSHKIIVCDLENNKTLKNKIDDLKKSNLYPDIIINNSGGPPPSQILDAQIDDFDKYIKSHLFSSHLLTKAFIPNMKKNQFGRIINIISISVKAPIKNLGVSNTIRWAMASWAKTLSNEVAKYGITVNNILPGFTDTERLRSLLESRSLNERVSIDYIEKQYKNNIPAGRFGSPEDIANGALFLCSNKANYINGINLPIDGGFTPTL